MSVEEQKQTETLEEYGSNVCATDGVAGTVDEHPTLRDLWNRAIVLQHEGVNLGIYGARISESMAALDGCQQVLEQLLTAASSSCSSSWNETERHVRHQMIRVCIHQAELHLVLFQYEPVKTACRQALRHHEAMVMTLRLARTKAHLKDAVEVDRETDELDVLKADIYRCLSIVDYRLGDEQHKYWDLEGKRLLEGVVARDANNERAKSLLALFWSYQITTGDMDGGKAVQDSIQAIDWLGVLYEQPSQPQQPLQQAPFSTYENSEDREVYARRLAVVLRLASYAFRDVGRLDESMEAIRGALDVIRLLCRQRPCAVIYLFELYHCQCALAEHLELMGGPEGDDMFVLEARKDAVSALARLTDLLPHVPKYWRSLCTTLIDVADLQERNGSGLLALESSSKALDAATRCLACCSARLRYDNTTITTSSAGASGAVVVTQTEPEFEDQVEYARALLERGRHFYIQKVFQQALPFYEQALGVYVSNVLNHDRAQRDDEFYVELILRSMQAASSCATLCNSEDATNKAIWFLDQARTVSKDQGGVKLRKNKVLCASLLLELAELHLTKKGSPHKAILILQQDVLDDLISPLRLEHPWHVTVGTLFGDAQLLLATCFMATGDLKHEVKYRQEFLRYAGKKHGKDFSSWIGEDSYEWEDDKLTQFRVVCDKEVPPVKKYRLPVRNQMGQVSWYSLEVGSAIPNQDPLEHQARVWKEDYGVEIAEDIRESFRKLHDLALRNSIPMTELCDYALSSASSSSGNHSSSASSSADQNNNPQQGQNSTENPNPDDENDGGINNDEGTVSTAAESMSAASENEDEDVDEPQQSVLLANVINSNSICEQDNNLRRFN